MVIQKETYHQWLDQPSLLQQHDLKVLTELMTAFPFCQTNHLLHTKCLQNISSFHYNQSLKRTAAYASDRHRLFHLLTEKASIKKNKSKPTSKKTPPTKKDNSTGSEIDIKNQLSIGQPLGFQQQEKHSFNEWLKLSQVKPIQRIDTKKNLTQKVSLIEDFIANRKRPSKKTAFFSAPQQAKESQSFHFDIVTETLAKVYLEQQHYEKAKQAYQQLSLKYPQKSSLFATQIELIEQLIKTNK